MGKLLIMPNNEQQNESQKIEHWLKLAETVLNADEEADAAGPEQSERETPVRPPQKSKKVG